MIKTIDTNYYSTNNNKIIPDFSSSQLIRNDYMLENSYRPANSILDFVIW